MQAAQHPVGEHRGDGCGRAGGGSAGMPLVARAAAPADEHLRGGAEACEASPALARRAHDCLVVTAAGSESLEEPSSPELRVSSVDEPSLQPSPVVPSL